MARPKSALNDLSAYRKATGLNQSDFWKRFGVTQSGGSRYESGRKMPRGIPTLLRLAFGPEATALKLLENLRTRVTQPQ